MMDLPRFRDDAEQIALFEKQRRATPHGDVQSVTMFSHAREEGGQYANQLEITLGDRITLSEEPDKAHC